ncbi:MAG TPA: response regulator [Pirellulales bacterium]|jgi:response regulator NasT|nr:response regulator [Pirellulales bacterium]
MSGAGLRIVVADDDQAMLRTYIGLLASLGHRVEATAQSGRELVDQCHALCPDLVISDYKMPDMDGLAAASMIYEQAPTPVIMVSGYSDAELIQQAQDNHVLVFVVKPLSVHSLTSAIDLAMQRYGEFRLVRQEAFDLRQTLNDRKLVEQAKAVLMRRASVDEREAFQRVARFAAEERQSLCQAAQMIVKVDRTFGGGDSPTPGNEQVEAVR